MYTRPPQGRFPRGMRIPQNYSGNAFRPTGEDLSERKQTEEAASPSPPPSDKSEASPDSAYFTEPSVAALSEESRDKGACQDEHASKGAPSFHFSLKNLFPGLGKEGSAFGSEELMLLALILLLSGGENNDDLILLLVLLLFIR